MAFNMKVFIAIFALMVSGCTANHNTAFRMRSIGGTNAVLFSVDAKQRMILSSYRQFEQNNNGLSTKDMSRRFCSEPSPDVFSVLAQSVGLGASFGKSGNPASIEAALNLAVSSSEQGTSIARTQTINMLREIMFRTCERYLSGGYDDVELSVQAIRDQRLIVSILAIESLTGAVAPKPVVIGVSGSAGAGATGDAIVRYDDARQRHEDADAAKQKADRAVETACKPPDGKTEADLSEDQKKKCGAARDDQATAQKELNAATEAHADLSRLSKTGSVTAITTPGSNSVVGGVDHVNNSASVAIVAPVIQAIVEKSFSDDTEVMLFCLRALRPKNQEGSYIPSAKIEEMCEGYLLTRTAAASARAGAEFASQVQAARAEISAKADTQFAIFWRQKSAALATQTTRDAFVESFKKQIIKPDWPKAECFRNAMSESAASDCFAKLTILQQNFLLQQ